MFDIAIVVAKARLWYHANMCSVINAANQLGMIKDDDANRKNEKHFRECLDAMERMGLDVKGYFEKKQ